MYQKIILKNDIRLILTPIKSTNTTTVLVMIGTGSRHERKDLNGISHFLEHMFFKGTKKRKNTLSISTELDRIGANYNAFTGKEATGFYIKTDAKHLDLSLDVISDILLNSNFSSQEINKERGVILEEMKMVQDTPMHYIEDLFESLLYEQSALGQLIIGTKKNILNFQRKDFLNYLNNRYRSKNIVICVAGRENEVKKSKNKIENFFRSTPKGKAKVDNVREFKNKQKIPQILVYNKKTDQTHICLGVRSYGLKDERKFSLKLLATILGGNMSSRLFIEIREKRGLAYYVRSSQNSYIDRGYLSTQAGIDKNKIEEGIKIILKEYKKIAQRGISDEELKKAKEYIKGISSISLETSDQLAGFFANQEILLDKITTLKENFKKIDEVSVDDIKNIAQDIFRDNRLNLAIIGDCKNKNKFFNFLKF